ncbi:hypothetical protein MPER_03531, partial [Moniliophthora perniciosa FA553]
MRPRRKRNPGRGIGYIDNLKGISRSIPPTYLAKVSEKANAIWCIHDIIALCNYLAPHVGTTGDTRKFKKTILTGAVNLLNSQVVVGGSKKENGVRDKIRDLLAIFTAVEYLRTRSGGHWSDETGASIFTAEDEVVWSSIIIAKPD